MPGISSPRVAQLVAVGAVVVVAISAVPGLDEVRAGWGLSYDIAMAELAANSLLPAGGAGGLALGVWALRQGEAPRPGLTRVPDSQTTSRGGP